jgi:hypothetical protein
MGVPSARNPGFPGPHPTFKIPSKPWALAMMLTGVMKRWDQSRPWHLLPNEALGLLWERRDPRCCLVPMSDVPTAPIEQLTLDRVREYQRVIEALSRIGPQAVTPQQLMQHVTAQVSRATMISRTKVLRYRPEKGDLLVEAGVGWKPGVVGNATLAGPSFPGDFRKRTPSLASRKSPERDNNSV